MNYFSLAQNFKIFLNYYCERVGYICRSNIHRLKKLIEMKKSFLAIALALFFIGTTVQAQIQTPAASPGSTVSQRVGLTDVKVEYSRPAMKGRTIFAKEGLVSFGNIWRTGANNATKIDFSNDVTVGGKSLKKGSYAILTKPDAASWEVNFYAYTDGNWMGYVEKTPEASVKVVPQMTSPAVESFSIGFDNITSTGASLQLSWDKTLVSVQIETEVDKAVMANISSVMAGPSSGDYYAAASYYHDNGKDLKKALEWIKKANEGSDKRFWQVRREALILADLGMKKEAIAAAKLSMELAKAAGNEEYVKMNEKSIASWSM